jgi:hypothetical protein
MYVRTLLAIYVSCSGRSIKVEKKNNTKGNILSEQHCYL